MSINIDILKVDEGRKLYRKSKNNQEHNMSQEQQENEEILDEDDEFDEGDYGFVISANGELKSILMPEDLMDDPPIEIKRILKIFGIKNIHQLEPRTLH